ncbi:MULTISPECIES: hypothetical protein [Brachybacterium]|uniref:YtxH domain-containing protein n=1 Tax=Brachybacterium alimentarium TaxID=47845 RepID=A0A2A3YG37_9MICO|nr:MULTISPECIES: hypothetical protein [Brachybacterium]PCC31848.1 hypothetical protein CIK71_12830 [Brachybacterium alimentarium]PCC38316.1 hypothetical protein CIK66_14885 [Brachybacterium alimentarium]RCS66841.1 hypothetical protein CIK81_00060 [Brachybacterium sp. JB7]RCS71867.1 hypothetical protein CIK73_01770 [Brachybacterium alimentarium]RCS74228.1 hypothetical protein CIK68_08205 [Brachybacterium alimentarium]
MKKLIFLTGLAIGFVVGSRAGRGPYESLERTARQVADDPEVQRRASEAKEKASQTARDTASTVKEKAPEVASAAQGAVAGAASNAKDRLSGDQDELDEDASALAGKSEDTASTGGDAAVGEDHPLSS